MHSQTEEKTPTILYLLIQYRFCLPNEIAELRIKRYVCLNLRHPRDLQQSDFKAGKVTYPSTLCVARIFWATSLLRPRWNQGSARWICDWDSVSRSITSFGSTCNHIVMMMLMFVISGRRGEPPKHGTRSDSPSTSTQPYLQVP